MKKINGKFDLKDRVVCVSVPNSHQFYFQPSGSRERRFLFRTDYFSGSVFAFFRDKGRNMDGRGFSLTIRELYEFNQYHNKRLSALISRLPGCISDVLSEKENRHDKPQKPIVRTERAFRHTDSDNDDIAA